METSSNSVAPSLCWLLLT